MNVNDMISAMSAKSVDAMVYVEPYNAIAEADGIARHHQLSRCRPGAGVHGGHADFVEKSPDTVVAYLKSWIAVADDFKNHPDKVADVVYKFYTSKGYKMDRNTFMKAMSAVEVNPGFPDLKPYMPKHAEALLAAKKIKAIPDWSKALRPEFMNKARAGA